MIIEAALLLAPTPLVTDPPAPPAELLTVAESSGYEATATSAEVEDLVERLAARADHVRAGELGRTGEGRPIPLMIVARPPLETAGAARTSGKLVAFAFGNIHAGEVCGKEGLLMLARELALDPEHPLLEHLVIVLAPNYNADGNDRMSPDNRPGQAGPLRGMGQRPNAQGLDLNRDYVKLESPEARALARFMDEWDPHLTIDTHTTNGSHHRYTLTYDAPLNPSGHPAPIEFVRDDLLPAVSERLAGRTGYETFFYGNLIDDRRVWATYSPLPRFGGNYQGLRGQMSILSEAYSYAPYRDRVLCTLEFVREILQLAAERREEIMAIHREARAGWGPVPRPDEVIGLRHRAAAHERPATIKGWAMERNERGRWRPTDEPHDYEVVHLGRFEPTLSVSRPRGYLVPAELRTVIEKLDQHGVRHLPAPADMRLVEAYRVESIDRAARPFQGHRLVLLDVSVLRREAAPAPDARFVPTAQPLGRLAAYLLEPQSEDGLVAWNFLDDHLEEGAEYPILRVVW